MSEGVSLKLVTADPYLEEAYSEGCVHPCESSEARAGGGTCSVAVFELWLLRVWRAWGSSHHLARVIAQPGTSLPHRQLIGQPRVFRDFEVAPSLITMCG